jgi:dTDP-4-amino-4,6-dideoxy-D-galactose acyltransferase
VDSLVALQWDTNFFGFSVARITNPRANPDQLQQAVRQMQQQGIRLAYWFADQPTAEMHASALSLGAALVDQKLTFVASTIDLPDADFPAMPRVAQYHDGMSIDDLKQLAVDSGVYSRFVVDANFPRNVARALFEEWIVRSLNKTVADEVLVIPQDSSIAGMVTLSHSGPRAVIGLLAVDARFRGQGLGGTLVRAALNWAREHGFPEIQVVTQDANVAARHLYVKSGFQLEKSEACYHFWSAL